MLVSGRGSNLQAIIDNIQAGKLDAEIRTVVSDVKQAYALERARAAALEAAFIDPAGYGSRGEFEAALVDHMKKSDVDLVVLAGFMRVLSPVFVNAFPNRIMNIHPALLPSFPGLHVQRKALEHGVKFAGCTVHFVDESVDGGPIIIQAVVPIMDDDNEDTLSARILKQEHLVYSRAIQLFAEGRLSVKGRHVYAGGALTRPNDKLINPPLT